MHGAIATDYVKKRMAEMGYGDNYTLRLRHFLLREAEVQKISAPNQLMVLIEAVEMVRITSDSGLFDVAADANELQYEHSGSITLTNLSNHIVHIRFVQAIPY